MWRLFRKVALTSLMDAEGTTQFLDRDTSAKSVLPILSDFMSHKNIHRTTTELANVRLKDLFASVTSLISG